jgi:hypothetical protein
MARNQIEGAQQKQLILHYKQVLLPSYPALRVTYTKNEGDKNIIVAKEDQRMGQEAGHPDLKWRIKYAGHYYFLYHELKKSDGKLTPSQEKWWDEFAPTEFVKGAITHGWNEHLEAIENWLTSIMHEQESQQ